jgi:hypothetical protein
MSIQLSQQSAKQWLQDGKAFRHPKHGLAEPEWIERVVMMEIKKELPEGTSNLIPRAYLNGTPIGLAKKVARQQLGAAFREWLQDLDGVLAVREGLDDDSRMRNAVTALMEHEHMRVAEVRIMLRMIAAGLIRPKMDTRFIAADLVECIQIYQQKRTQAVADYERSQSPEQNVSKLPPAANVKQGEATIAKLIEKLDLEPVSPSLRAKWMSGAKLSEHERQQIRKEVAGQTQGQAQEQGAGSARQEDARTTQEEGR